MNYIELFAGCGGLSVGMKATGFNLVLANEISPMAAETYAFNLLGEDLTKSEKLLKTFWLRSAFNRSDALRLREDYRAVADKCSDELFTDLNLSEGIESLQESLIVGSILDLNELLSKEPALKQAIATSFGCGQVDMVSGGPPCQSFSLAGLRDHASDKNKLPWAFAEFVSHVKPKMVLLENVSGILRAFKVNGQSHYAWFEVAKAFASKECGYVPVCLHINAKNVGAAQNRPRFIMLGFEKTFADQVLISGALGLSGQEVFTRSLEFFEEVQKGGEPGYDKSFYYDLGKGHPVFNEWPFDLLNQNPIKKSLPSPTVSDAINDIKDVARKTQSSEYVDVINKMSSSLNTLSDFESGTPPNHELRSNNKKVKARFRVYQIISKLSNKLLAKQISLNMKNPELNPLPMDSAMHLKKERFISLDGESLKPITQHELEELLRALRTKKQTQRALIPSAPAPAALSIPDDACHYDKEQLRTLTVREMARFQSFPDSFEFRSKVTTGGKMRAFEVPQYTQVGNAVPPILGMALGNVCKALLGIVKK